MSDTLDVDMKTPTKKAKTSPKETAKVKSKPSSKGFLEKNDEPKKITTKTMIQDALVELNTRKGVSLQAIKKFLHEKYSIDTEKSNYLIKKSIKNSVESGTVVQIKGIGASGSFKLAVTKKDKKKPKPVKENEEKPKKVKEKKPEKPVKPKKGDNKVILKKSDEKVSKKKSDLSKEGKPKKKEVEIKEGAVKKDSVKKTKSIKVSKGMQTPLKKKGGILKRKSIGSVIKAPKMKPKSKIG